ncbi:MAG: tRNA uridine-5-carboxymethylaminomethyl(34) synthesis enzyme MnmG, partial [Duncaniella sp.]|nr:tRNA uridine-5-carboxymethylaminomethyl(34) synthesis enzyme MnmG [Duncaniella sp.]
FSRLWREILENTPGLDIWQDAANSLVIEDGCVKGVRTVLGVTFTAKSVVLTAGTFLNGLMHIGPVKVQGGRVAEPASSGLTEQLRSLGFVTDRMKTGTPVRIDGRSVNWGLTTLQEGENDFHKFSYLTNIHRKLRQRPCHTVYTNPETHRILREGLPDSPLYNGQIKSIGPRYCPSIETKIVTFADKNEHQLFLEPEGEVTQEYYLNGFSSSLPVDIQIRALETIPALKEVQIYRPGYAIEYDFFDPTQLYHSLETKLVSGLYFAGQVNGTTGYEEAAGQGLVAGINAALKVKGEAPFTLARDEAYIGVLIDDLVTKGVDEPYRMFTSRAEYRILLRQDDADMRLTPRGHSVGLASDYRYEIMESKRRQRDALIDFCREFSVKTALINPYLESIGEQPLKQGVKLYDLVLRPALTIRILAEGIAPLAEFIGKEIEEARRDEIIEAAEILIKYQGYIQRESQIADKLRRLENLVIRG